MCFELSSISYECDIRKKDYFGEMNLLGLKLVGSGGSLEDTLISHSNVILCESCTLNSGRHCLKVITLESPLPIIVETTLASEFEPRMNLSSL